MYSAKDKMCDLMCSEHQALQMISRFGLPLGVGDKSIAEVCAEHDVHCKTFLTIINYKINDTESTTTIDFSQLSLPTMITYLRNAHSYFFDFSLPRLRAKLIEAINYANIDSKIPMLIIQFFDEYVNEINIHMQHENEQVFPYVEKLLQGIAAFSPFTIEQFAHQHRAVDDQHIASKLTELKNLIVKYYPQTTQNNLLNSALFDIFATEQDLATHCAIEDEIFLPAVRNLEKKKHSSATTNHHHEEQVEELSDREKDVLVQLVNGLSNKEIADKLCISVHTVITHRKNITRKLHIHSVAGLTIYAIVNNLVDIKSL